MNDPGHRDRITLCITYNPESVLCYFFKTIKNMWLPGRLSLSSLPDPLNEYQEPLAGLNG